MTFGFSKSAFLLLFTWICKKFWFSLWFCPWKYELTTLKSRIFKTAQTTKPHLLKCSSWINCMYKTGIRLFFNIIALWWKKKHNLPFISTNLATHLANQFYNICFRRASTYCALCFWPKITSGTQQSFGLG